MDALSGSNNTKDLDKYLDQIDVISTISLDNHIKNLLKEKGMTPSGLIKASRIERTYCYQILNGRKRPGRDKVLAIALALELTLEETQRLLAIAKEGVLYPKSRRDSVIIFALNKHYSLINTNLLLANYNEAEIN
ncbi:MAG: helix-turn-helix transcriptional regulator [Clostridia bacterium]|nr:helix-turn-helix transcriptional regulator [Clostridia bacterium]